MTRFETIEGCDCCKPSSSSSSSSSGSGSGSKSGDWYCYQKDSFRFSPIDGESITVTAYWWDNERRKVFDVGTPFIDFCAPGESVLVTYYHRDMNPLGEPELQVGEEIRPSEGPFEKQDCPCDPAHERDSSSSSSSSGANWYCYSMNGLDYLPIDGSTVTVITEWWNEDKRRIYDLKYPFADFCAPGGSVLMNYDAVIVGDTPERITGEEVAPFDGAFKKEDCPCHPIEPSPPPPSSSSASSSASSSSSDGTGACCEEVGCSDCEWPDGLPDYSADGEDGDFGGVRAASRSYTSIYGRTPIEEGKASWKPGYPAALAGEKYIWWYSSATAYKLIRDEQTGKFLSNRKDYMKTSLLVCRNGRAVDITDEATSSQDLFLRDSQGNVLVGTKLQYGYCQTSIIGEFSRITEGFNNDCMEGDFIPQDPPPQYLHPPQNLNCGNPTRYTCREGVTADDCDGTFFPGKTCVDIAGCSELDNPLP